MFSYILRVYRCICFFSWRLQEKETAFSPVPAPQRPRWWEGLRFLLSEWAAWPPGPPPDPVPLVWPQQQPKLGKKIKQNKVALFTTACQEETHTPLSWNKYSYILHFGDFSLSLYGMNFPWKVSLKFHVWTTEGQWCGFSLTVTLYKSSPDGWFIKERLLLLFKELLLWAQEQH